MSGDDLDAAFGGPPLDRRRFMLLAAAAVAPATVSAQETESGPATEAETAPAFGFDSVLATARERAEAGHEPRRLDLPGVLADLNYDAYRDIRYREDRRLWTGENRGFTVDLLPPGSIFQNKVQIFAVEDGRPRPLAFDPSALHFAPERFGTEDGAAPAVLGEDLTWSGFRLRYPLNAPEVADEVAVFQGASYFRAIGRDQIFGLSARGLAVGTASPEGEEFPVFTDFWLVRPEPNAVAITVYALLDSESVVGAYEFVIRPGAETTMDVRSVLIPRRDLSNVGVAPLTSMFYFGPKDRTRADDYRDAVHDSSGLQMLTGHGERLWRPLSNPVALEISFFGDENPKGFGLVQRERRFEFYQDAEARYERRPSAWVAPNGDWGKGAVELIEIPSDTEFNDNIVAFWRPEAPLAAGEERNFDYRLFWSAHPPDEAPLARVMATRSGRATNNAALRALVVDFHLGEQELNGLRPEVEASRGAISWVTLQRLPVDRGARATIEFEPPEGEPSELRLVLVDADGGRASETWLFRWSPQ